MVFSVNFAQVQLILNKRSQLLIEIGAVRGISRPNSPFDKRLVKLLYVLNLLCDVLKRLLAVLLRLFVARAGVVVRLRLPVRVWHLKLLLLVLVVNHVLVSDDDWLLLFVQT